MNDKEKLDIIKKLVACFPRSFLNERGEFIAHAAANVYFIFESSEFDTDCKSELDVKCKVLEFFSRPAFKSAPFEAEAKNKQLHNFMLNGINKFLGTSFDFVDMELIYTLLGCKINRSLTIKFIESGFDMQVLRENDNRKQQITFF